MWYEKCGTKSMLTTLTLMIVLEEEAQQMLQDAALKNFILIRS